MRRSELKIAKNQGGWVFLSIISVFAIMTLILITGYSAYYTKIAILQLDSRQEKYLSELRTSLTDAYKANAWEIDSFSGQAQWRFTEKWQSVAGFTEKWSLSGVVSDRLSKNGVYYTVIVYWMELESDSVTPPSFDKATGVFTPCPGQETCSRKWIVVDGYPIQQEKYAQTLATMNEIGIKAETYFKARYSFDPDRDIMVNYFRPTTGVCSAPTDEDLPCVDLFTAISDAGVQHKLAIDNRQMKNGWGHPILISNKEESQLSQPPYSLAIRTEFPWGGSFTVNALQPI